MILVEVSIGEILDKLTILSIKKNRISDPEKLVHIGKEYDILEEKSKHYLDSKEVKDLFDELIEVNLKLWIIEDDLRDLESQKRFDDEFVQKARLVYMTNDKKVIRHTNEKVNNNRHISKYKGTHRLFK